MTLGQEIKYYRKKNGLTQTAFGDLFGMSKQAVYSWETGLYSPDISVLLKMADFFQIPICVLVGRPGMYCQKSDDTRSNCDYCAPITDEDCLVIRALHALPPEKQQAVKTLSISNRKRTETPNQGTTDNAVLIYKKSDPIHGGSDFLCPFLARAR